MARGKLIRDRIPDLIRAQGRTPLTRIAAPGEYRRRLRDKLTEEAEEASGASPEQMAGELADVLEVVDAIARDAGLTRGDLERARVAKLVERGGFTGRILWMGNEGEPVPVIRHGLTRMLREAHDRFGASAPAEPTVMLDPGVEAERNRMLREEAGELEEAVAARDLRQIAKEGADVIYVAAGTLIAFGIDVDAAVAALHASNMTKEPAGNAKAVKGPGYRPPDMAAVLWPSQDPPGASEPAGDFEAE